MKKEELSFSYSEIIAELDKLRPDKTKNKPKQEIIDVIMYARDKEPQVTWPALRKFIHQKFNVMYAESTLRYMYNKYKNN